VKFLSQIGYVSMIPDPNDKRRYLVKVLKSEEKTCNYVHFEFARIFTPDSFKEWLNEANQIYVHTTKSYYTKIFWKTNIHQQMKSSKNFIITRMACVQIFL